MKVQNILMRRSNPAAIIFATAIIILLTSHSAHSIKLIDDIIHFKEKLIQGKTMCLFCMCLCKNAEMFLGIFGKGNCGCPCRDYYVPKCETTYVQKCYKEHYEEVSTRTVLYRTVAGTYESTVRV